MPTSPDRPDVAALRRRLPELMIRDERRLERRLDRAASASAAVRTDKLAAVAREIDRAAQRLNRRRGAVPAVRYPKQLPVSQRHDDLLAALRDHQVVVVAGETGSGKTTQLPKMCLELGRGVRGRIGHTQPRRIAARAVAERVAEELGVEVGGVVGYQVRFTDQHSEQTLVKLMTDGILLAEVQGDPLLLAYDTIILDEAHERSLTIDFLLGYLKQLLPRRPDLLLIITSATIDPQRFAEHFDGAPVIEVSGRTFPVEHRYRPVAEDDEPTQAVCEAVVELAGQGPGDVLVFLSGEREIRDTADALTAVVKGSRLLTGTEVLPLYGRLAPAEQHQVFSTHTGRRVVLATNVAETSLTVPGIRYVVDPGTARISRYSHRTKVQRLPIEPISQASARQRSGRCGRTADGVSVRLYSEDDFTARPEFTDPEILRTNLASVILRMAALGLGEIADFPFLDPPDRRQVRDGVQLLQELGALDMSSTDPRKRLTTIGRRLADLPVDPRIARMVLAADVEGCLREVLVIAAALSIQDPRLRPADAEAAADVQHKRFADPTSDFLAYLNLWRYVREQQGALSSSAFRRMCHAEHLHYLRIREWQDLHGQLRQSARALGLSTGDTWEGVAAEPQKVHRALLAGLLSHVGLRDAVRRDYLGARGVRFAIWPGSALFGKPPTLLIAAELVETARLWARVCARVEPEWVEPLAEQLVVRTYSEPHWEARRGAVVAYERVTLYGVPLVARRKVGYGAIDPELSRELFIRRALVEGDWRTHHRFLADNERLIAELEELENRTRRRDIVADDEAVFAFYDVRIPATVTSGAHFDAWWKAKRRTQPDLLTLTREDLLEPDSDQPDEGAYPDEWLHGDLRLPLTYQFEPGAAADGVTVHVPVAVLNQLVPQQFSWQIPVLRADLATALIRSLPKAWRRLLVPAPDTAREAVAHLVPDGRGFVDALAGELHETTGADIPPEVWAPEKVPGHLRMTFSVEDSGGHVLGEGKDLDVLRAQLVPQVRVSLAAAAPGIQRSGLSTGDFGSLPREVTSIVGGQPVRGYPALVDEGTTAAVRVLRTPDEQRVAMRAGTRRLLMLSAPVSLRALAGRLDQGTKLTLTTSPYPDVPALLSDCIACAVDDLVDRNGGAAWDEAGFAALVAVVRRSGLDLSVAVVTEVGRLLVLWREVRAALDTLTQPAVSVADARAQLTSLVRPGFVAETGLQRLGDLPRYLAALRWRLEVLPREPERDRARVAALGELQGELAAVRARRPYAEGLDDLRWMLEELRVSWFAQSLGTAYPVSDARVLRALDALEQ